MTTEELKAELNKRKEQEYFDGIVLEYIRVKSMLAESGALSPHEAEEIAIRICERSGRFGLF